MVWFVKDAWFENKIMVFKVSMAPLSLWGQHIGIHVVLIVSALKPFNFFKYLSSAHRNIPKYMYVIMSITHSFAYFVKDQNSDHSSVKLIKMSCTVFFKFHFEHWFLHCWW